MSDRDKKWENQPSQEGLGIVQDLLGIPNSPFLSKGELLLKQQERGIKLQEAINDQLSNADYRTIAVTPDNTEVMARIEGKIVDGLRTAMGDFADMAYDREIDLSSLESEISRHAQNSQEELQRIRNISQGIAAGISDLNQNMYGINSSLDYLSEKIPQGFDSLNKIGQKQAELLGKISQSIEVNGKNNETMLRGIAKLIIGQTKLVHEEGELTRMEIREAVSRAIIQIVSGLFHLQQEIAQGFDKVKGAIDNSTFRISAGLNEVRDSIDFGSSEIKRAIDNSTNRISNDLHEIEESIHMVGVEVQKTALEINQVYQTNQDINESIKKNTSTLKHNAENSEVIKANQYRDQGRELFVRGYLEEAKNRLDLALSLNNIDPDANFLLAEIFFQQKNYKLASKHFNLSQSFSISSQQYFEIELRLVSIEKTTKQHKKAIQRMANLIERNSSLYYSPEFKELLTDIEFKKAVLVLLNEHTQNNDIYLICMTEFCKINEYNLAAMKMFPLMQKFNISNLNDQICSEIVDNIHSIFPMFEYYINQIGVENLNSEALLSISTILFRAKFQIDIARKLLLIAYQKDFLIKQMSINNDFIGIATYLKFFLGVEFQNIKNYHEIPQEVRLFAKNL